MRSRATSVLHNCDGELLLEKHEVESGLLIEFLHRECNLTAGVWTFTMEDMRHIAEEILNEDGMSGFPAEKWQGNWQVPCG